MGSAEIGLSVAAVLAFFPERAIFDEGKDVVVMPTLAFDLCCKKSPSTLLTGSYNHQSPLSSKDYISFDAQTAAVMIRFDTVPDS